MTDSQSSSQQPGAPAPFAFLSGLSSATGVDSLVEPFSQGESSRVERVGRRLRAELGVLLRHLPEGDRGGSRMSRRLGIDRSVCQRVLGATRPDAPDLAIPSRAPGEQGLRSFLDAMRRDGAPSEALDNAEAALAEFTSLIVELAGSQACLSRRIDATLRIASGKEHADASRQAREAAFRAGVELVGHMAETNIQIVAFAGEPGMDIARVRGYHGFAARRDATPLVFRSGTYANDGVVQQDTVVNLNGDLIKGRSDDGVMKDFSTKPLPLVVSRGPRGALLQIVDHPSGAARTPLDVFTATKWAEPSPHPRTQTPPVEEAWAFSQHPSKRLVFDTFMHKSLARECIASLGVHLISPDMPAYIGQRWMDRLADTPELKVLPQDLNRCGTPHYARHTQLLEQFFNELAWDPADYVGHRCEVEYPIWNAGYCVSYDFSQQ